MMSIIVAIALIALLYAISWGFAVGIMYLICLCFSWNFSLITATGIWLIICLIKGAFSVVIKK